MAGESILIRELTGSQRSVVLRDRALPHRPVAFPREQIVKKTRYQGNPVATVQVLGPEHGPLEMAGCWKARYIAAAVSLWGFDDLWSEGDAVTPEIMVLAFDRLLAGGNLLEVSWGPEVRRGVLSRFEPSYQRVEDVDWSVTFTWTQAGSAEAPRATAAPDTQSDSEAALSGLEDTMARIPTSILPNVTTALLALETVAREAMLTLMGGVAAVSGIPSVGLDQFQRIASSASAVAEACGALATATVDASIETLVADGPVAGAVAAQCWAMDAGAAALVLAVVAIGARESVRGRVVSDYLAVVILRRNQTLRTLALEYYGSADAWTTIADANGLTASNPPVGTLILIPARASAGA